jgi:hypothetical protein
LAGHLSRQRPASRVKKNYLVGNDRYNAGPTDYPASSSIQSQHEYVFRVVWNAEIKCRRYKRMGAVQEDMEWIKLVDWIY